MVIGKQQAEQGDAIVSESTASVARFKRNTLGRDFVIADIHGAFDLLVIALAEIDFDPEVDRIFSTGDLIDRGESSHRCTEFISLPYFHSTLGNHESMLLDLCMQPSKMDLDGGWGFQMKNAKKFWKRYARFLM